MIYNDFLFRIHHFRTFSCFVFFFFFGSRQNVKIMLVGRYIYFKHEKLSWPRKSISYTSHTYTPKKYGILAFSWLFTIPTNFTWRGIIMASGVHFRCFTLSWRHDNRVRQDNVGQNPGNCHHNAVFTNTHTHKHTHTHTSM